MKPFVSVERAAELLGEDVQTTRLLIQSGHYTFGFAVKRKPENKRYYYKVNAHQLAEYLRIPVEEVTA